MAPLRTVAAVLSTLLLATMPTLVQAHHCDFFPVRDGISFSLCDNDSDGLADTVRVAATEHSTRGEAGAQAEDRGDMARVRGHYVFYAGGPLGPGLYSNVRADDNGANERFDDTHVSGGAYLGGSGLPRAAYVLAVQDPNDNGVPDDVTLTLCSTETGCRTLI